MAFVLVASSIVRHRSKTTPMNHEASIDISSFQEQKTQLNAGGWADKVSSGSPTMSDELLPRRLAYRQTGMYNTWSTCVHVPVFKWAQRSHRSTSAAGNYASSQYVGIAKAVDGFSASSYRRPTRLELFTSSILETITRRQKNPLPLPGNPESPKVQVPQPTYSRRLKNFIRNA